MLDLSPRGQQVAEMITAGLSFKEIGVKTHMATRTAKAHANRLYMRFQINDGYKKVKLAVLMYRQGNPNPVDWGSVRLRKKELEIVRLCNEGLKNCDIAIAINTTDHVVKNYLRQIFDKVGVWNRTELAIWFEARKLSHNEGDLN